MNPSFEPVIGNGFDAIAGQRQFWSGFNNNVDRANADSYANAVNQQGNYFRDVAAMNREDASAAADDERRQYQFGANQDYNNRYLDLERAKIAQAAITKAYEEKRTKAVADAQGDISAAEMLAQGGHLTDEEIDALDATKLQKDALREENRKAQTDLTQQYQFAGGLAKDENLKQLFTRETATPPTQNAPTSAESGYSWFNPEKYNPARLLGVGALARWAGTSAPPDTSWFDALQKKKAALDAKLAPYDTAKGAPIVPAGLILDPATGQYKPLTTPDWARGSTVSPAPATTSAPSTPKIGQLYKGYIYVGGNPADPASWKKA